MGIQSKMISIKKKTSFNREKYIKNIRQTIVINYATDTDTANKAINRSGLLKSLDFSPESTLHIDDDIWAEKIWNGYQKSLLK